MTLPARALLVGALLFLPLRAHRLDEYLQAALILVGHDHVTLDVSLTPGIVVYPAFLAIVDADGDGNISVAERSAYGRRFLADVGLWTGREPMELTVASVTFPPLEDLRTGLGTVRIALRAPLPAGLPGDFELLFRNSHQRKMGVYAVNALVPPAGIHILRQERDPDQTQMRLNVRQGDTADPQSASAMGFPWLLGAGLGAAALIAALASRIQSDRLPG